MVCTGAGKPSRFSVHDVRAGGTRVFQTPPSGRSKKSLETRTRESDI